MQVVQRSGAPTPDTKETNQVAAEATQAGEAVVQAGDMSGAAIVYRWSVCRDVSREFKGRLSDIVKRLVEDRAEEIEVARVCQPVFGPAGDVWELHVELRSVSAAGALLDHTGDKRSQPLWDLSDMALRTTEGERWPESSVQLLESGAPLYRTWMFRPRPSEQASPKSDPPAR